MARSYPALEGNRDMNEGSLPCCQGRLERPDAERRKVAVPCQPDGAGSTQAIGTLEDPGTLRAPGPSARLGPLAPLRPIPFKRDGNRFQTSDFQANRRA